MQWISFQTRHCKRFHCPLIRIFLHYQTACWSQSCISPTVQLDVSWTFEFGRSSEILSSSLSATCHHQRAVSKRVFSKARNFQMRHCQKSLLCFRWNSIHFHTSCWSEARSLSPAVQLDFCACLHQVNIRKPGCYLMLARSTSVINLGVQISKGTAQS